MILLITIIVANSKQQLNNNKAQNTRIQKIIIPTSIAVDLDALTLLIKY